MREAIDLGQSSSVPFSNYGGAMYIMGRHEEALESYERGVEYDPFSSVLHLNHAIAFHLAGRNEEAVEKVARCREVFSPGLFGFVQGLALVELGHGGEALTHFRETADAYAEWGFGLQMLAYGLVCAGEVDEGMALIQGLEDREPEEYLLPLGFTFAYCAVGDDEAALGRLEQSFDDRAGLPWIGSPAFRRLRANPRYKTILARLGVTA